MTKTFELGERRLVTLSVWLADGTAFDLKNATWSLQWGNQEESGGDCDVAETEKGYELSALVEPRQRRSYTLQYTFSVGEEIIKRSVQIEVK
jgi:hypothetical protein